MSTLLARVRASIERESRSIEQDETPVICPDCGSEPSDGFHWDNCTLDPLNAKRIAAAVEWDKLMSTPISW